MQENEVQIEVEPREVEIDVEPEKFIVNIDFNYNSAKDKPQINGEELVGNKTSAQLHLQDEMRPLSNIEIKKLLGGEI